MKPTIYPSLQETLGLHRQLILRFGGAEGVRDRGLLESALVRPRTGYYDTLSMQAAALLQSLCPNHCFVDGNKRAAFATAAVFLLINGYSLRIDPNESEAFIVDDVIGNRAEIETIASWLEARMVPAKS